MTEADMRAVVHSLGDDAVTWIAERVMAVRFRFPGEKIIEEALIKWKGWDRESDCTWQDLATIESPELEAEAAECRRQDRDQKKGKERSSSSSGEPGPS
eukprot:4267107-Pleurochrysis_carterae.AAC.1